MITTFHIIYLQTWHIPPRHQGLAPQAVTAMVVQKSAKKERTNSRQCTEGVRSTLYNALHAPLAEVHLDEMLLPAMMQMSPQPQYVQLWEPPRQQPPFVMSLFGEVPKGSLLSYQLCKPASTSGDILNIPDIPPPPPFEYPLLERTFQAPLEYAADCLYSGQEIDVQLSAAYEKETREQASSSKWHELRKCRITASNFKRICSRRANHEKLAQDLVKTKSIQTKAMRYGLEQEPVAARNYAETFGRNIYMVGFVVNPSAFHLGCSPDRRVYDPDATDPRGLLEVKCPSVNSITECKYLVKDGATGNLHLKTTHEYYYQVQGQMGLTGASWCDFYVQALEDFHCERITADRKIFKSIKEKLDQFYFIYFLHALVASKK